MTKLFIEIIRSKEKELEALKGADYEHQNWAYKQADNNGARRMLRTIKDLLNDPI